MGQLADCYHLTLIIIVIIVIIVEPALCNDLIALSDCIKIVRSKLSSIIQLSFENDLFQLVRVEEVAHQIASDLLGLG